MPTPSSLVDQVLAEIEALRPRLLEAVSEAVRIPSVNPQYPGQVYEDHVGREGDVARLLARLYEEAGLTVDVFAEAEGRENAVGLLEGVGGGRSLIINGHTDVVPPGRAELWTGGEPFSGREDDGRIWGRGSTDMKGGVLAAAFAALALQRCGVRLDGTLILEGVVGEETGSHELGTTATIRRGYTADAAVIAEPTAPPSPLAVTPVTPGFLWFVVKVEGKAAHCGLRGPTVMPTRMGAAVGVNAIDKAFLVFETLRRLEDEWAEHRRHPLFENGHFGILPGVIHGGPHGVDLPFFLADWTTIEYAALFHPDWTVEQVKAELTERIGMAARLDPWLRDHPPEIEWRLEWEAWKVPIDAPICTAMARAHERAATGTRFEGPAELRGFSGVCDATWFERAGIPCIVYGPGDLRVAHQADESVDVDELVAACRAYAVLAMEWCGVAT